MSILSTNEPTVKNLLDEGDGQPRYKALCRASGCDWSYEHKTGYLARAHSEAHCYKAQHAVDLRLDILDVFIDRIRPAIKSEITGEVQFKAPALSKRALAELKQEMEKGCQQMMSPDPHSTDSCSAPVFCVTCAACDEHCGCAEPLTLEELTTTTENERRADR